MFDLFFHRFCINSIRHFLISLFFILQNIGRDSSKRHRNRTRRENDSDSYESDEDDSTEHAQNSSRGKHRSRSAHTNQQAAFPSPPYPGYAGAMYSPYPGMVYPPPAMMPHMMSPMGTTPVMPMAQSTPMSYPMQYAASPGQHIPAAQGMMMPGQQGQFVNSQGMPIAMQGHNVSGVGPLEANQLQRSRVSPSKTVLVNGQEVPVYTAGQQAPPVGMIGNHGSMINSSNIPSNQILSPSQAGGLYSGNQSTPSQLMTSSPGLAQPGAVGGEGLNPQYSRSRRLSDPMLQFDDPSLPLGGSTLSSGLMKPSVSTPNLLGGSRDANVVCREHNRQISLLLAELNAAKDMNKKASIFTNMNIAISCCLRGENFFRNSVNVRNLKHCIKI